MKKQYLARQLKNNVLIELYLPGYYNNLEIFETGFQTKELLIKELNNECVKSDLEEIITDDAPLVILECCTEFKGD